MVVKPIALIALAALVIAAAGAGAYLAVRDNSAPTDVVIDPARGEDGADSESDAGLSAATQAVEATEEVIRDEVEDEDDPPVTNATPVPAQTPHATPPRSSAPEQGTRRSDANRPTSGPQARGGSPQPRCDRT